MLERVLTVLVSGGVASSKPSLEGERRNLLVEVFFERSPAGALVFCELADDMLLAVLFIELEKAESLGVGCGCVPNSVLESSSDGCCDCCC